MSKVEVCDLCQAEIMARYEDRAYKFVVKERWHSYDGFVPYRETGKLDICFICMRSIIDATEQRRPLDTAAADAKLRELWENTK